MKMSIFKTVDLAGEMLKKTIHDGGEAVKNGWKKQQLFSEGRDTSRVSSREIVVLP